LYNAVSDVADRLREVDNGVATPYKREIPITSYSDLVDRIDIPVLLVAITIAIILPKDRNDDDYDDDGTFSGRTYRGSRSNSESTWSGGSSSGGGGGASW